MRRGLWGGLGLVVAAALPVAARAEPAGTVVSAVERAEEAPYDPAGRRDPFRPPRVGVALGEPRTPLQRYELGQLRLVAVIYEAHEPRAVLEDDQGLGYIVKVGTAVGPNGGQVRTIERGRIVIEEDSVDFYGDHHPSEVAMMLRTAEGGKR
jgi:type IV pilus assembly protein PilP